MNDRLPGFAAAIWTQWKTSTLLRPVQLLFTGLRPNPCVRVYPQSIDVQREWMGFRWFYQDPNTFLVKTCTTWSPECNEGCTDVHCCAAFWGYSVFLSHTHPSYGSHNPYDLRRMANWQSLTRTAWERSFALSFRIQCSCGTACDWIISAN